MTEETRSAITFQGLSFAESKQLVDLIMKATNSLYENLDQLAADAMRYRYLKTCERGVLYWDDGFLDMSQDDLDVLVDFGINTYGIGEKDDEQP